MGGEKEWSVAMLKEELAWDLGDGLNEYAKAMGITWSEEEILDRGVGMILQGVEDWVRENMPQVRPVVGCETLCLSVCLKV